VPDLAASLEVLVNAIPSIGMSAKTESNGAAGAQMKESVPVPTPRRPSLTPQQVRDPLGTLAEAYGVPRGFPQVVDAIRDKCFPDRQTSTGFDREGSAVGQVVGVLIMDGRMLARVYRGTPLPKRQKNFVTKTTDTWRRDLPSGELAEMLYSEIRSSLARLNHPASRAD
jgi:hypothetical protein